MVLKSFNSSIALCNLVITICISITIILAAQVLIKSGDIEINLGPKKSSAINFCYWNLNGLVAHDLVKIPLIVAFINAHNFDIVCQFKTILDSTIPHNDANINITGNSLWKVDHPNNVKRGEVCMYFKRIFAANQNKWS